VNVTNKTQCNDQKMKATYMHVNDNGAIEVTELCSYIAS